MRGCSVDVYGIPGGRVVYPGEEFELRLSVSLLELLFSLEEGGHSQYQEGSPCSSQFTQKWSDSSVTVHSLVRWLWLPHVPQVLSSRQILATWVGGPVF